MQASIYQISPFDANVGTTIKFSWSGNRAFKNRCIIKNNDTNVTVYDNTITTFELAHTIDLTQANLINGIKYNAYITVFDQYGVESDIQSIPNIFWCLTSPVFRFKNLPNQNIINGSTYGFSLEYSQAQNEQLDKWSITLYNESKSQISSSGIQYDTSNTSHTFTGFDNNVRYYIRGTGETVNGFSLDTGYISLSTSYTDYRMFSLMDAENVSKNGSIRVEANLSSTIGELDHKPAQYINDTYIDLRNNGVLYDDGFELSGDFSLIMKFNVPDSYDGKTIAILYGDDAKLTINYRLCHCSSNTLERRFELIIESNGIKSYVYSNNVLSVASDNKNKDNIYELHIFRESSYYGLTAKFMKEGL